MLLLLLRRILLLRLLLLLLCVQSDLMCVVEIRRRRLRPRLRLRHCPLRLCHCLHVARSVLLMLLLILLVLLLLLLLFLKRCVLRRHPLPLGGRTEGAAECHRRRRLLL